MKYIFTILFLLSCTPSFGLVINKVLIIDTVVGDINNFTVRVIKPLDSILNDDYENRFRPQLRQDKYPNLQVNISDPCNNSCVRLPLDDSGGYLILENVFQCKSDTIRISKLVIFHNCLPDSSHFSMSWYKTSFNDSGQHPVRIKPIKRNRIIYKKNDCMNAICDSTFFTINGVSFSVPLKIVRGYVLVTNYCFGHKIMGKWRTRRYERRRLSGKPYKYFSASVEIQKYILKASIDLGSK